MDGCQGVRGELWQRSSMCVGPDGWQERKGYPVKVEPNKLAKDETLAKKLWDVSEKLTGIKLI